MGNRRARAKQERESERLRKIADRVHGVMMGKGKLRRRAKAVKVVEAAEVGWKGYSQAVRIPGVGRGLTDLERRALVDRMAAYVGVSLNETNQATVLRLSEQGPAEAGDGTAPEQGAEWTLWRGLVWHLQSGWRATRNGLAWEKGKAYAELEECDRQRQATVKALGEEQAKLEEKTRELEVALQAYEVLKGDLEEERREVDRMRDRIQGLEREGRGLRAELERLRPIKDQAAEIERLTEALAKTTGDDRGPQPVQTGETVNEHVSGDPILSMAIEEEVERRLMRIVKAMTRGGARGR